MRSYVFDRENFIHAARARVGKPVIRHQEVVPDCWGQTKDECLAIGLGPDSFDCSGLVISSLGQALGIELNEWPKNLRHVRDFWNNGDPWAGKLLDKSQVQAGDVLVVKKVITVDGMRGFYPCHLAIVSGAYEAGFDVVHAKLNPREIVEERLGEVWAERVLGGIAIDPKAISAGTLDIGVPKN